jgi:hypothetical protein
MSFDLNLTTPCDHLVFRELTVLDNDARTIHFEKPVAVTSTVQVFAADNLLPSSLYNIVEDKTDLLHQASVIKFSDKWRSPTDYFEISYTTIPTYCSKCAGNKFIDDISYDVRGDLLTVRNEKLLMQSVEKFTVTRINSNPFHPFVGTGLIGLIGTRVTNPSFLVSQITAEESKTLQKLQDLQSQYQLTGREVTEGEMLQSIDNIQVTQDQDDPTILRMDVTVTAQSGQTVEFTQYLKVYN